MTSSPGGSSATIPATDPFTAVAAHFGMLLGVDDLETIIGQPWAKMRLHSAWLHGSGVVWGGGVSVDAASREIRVEPFLAIDELGRELMIATQSCVDLQKWYDANQASVTNRGDQDVVFDGVVVAHYRACLDRAVPTLVSPCDGSSADTAYSRLRETAELFLLPADAGSVPVRPERYPRLRALRGLPSSLADADREALLAQDAAATSAQDHLDIWREAAAADVAGRHPSTTPGDDPLYDGSEPAYVVLARLTGLTLSATQPVTAAVDDVDLGVRTAHVDTSTIVDLLSADAPWRPGGQDGPVGPRLVAGSAARNGDTITFDLTEPVVESTLATGVAVHRFDATDGWVAADAGAPTLAGSTVTVPVTAGLDDQTVLRLVVSGTGPTPVVGPAPDAGAPPTPFCGSTDRRADPDGTDAVLTLGGTP